MKFSVKRDISYTVAKFDNYLRIILKTKSHFFMLNFQATWNISSGNTVNERNYVKYLMNTM